MTFAATGTAPNITITQTGTDASLAGLAGISGVTVTGTNIKTYLLSGAKLVINGEVTFDPRFEQVVAAEDCPYPEITVTGASAVLTVGAAGGSRPPAAAAVTVRRRAAESWNGGLVGLLVEGGGKITWHYGDYLGASGVWFRGGMHSGSYFGGRINTLAATAGGPALIIVDGVITFGPNSEIYTGGINFNGTTPALSGVSVIDGVTGLHAAGGTLAAPTVFDNVTLLGVSAIYPWGQKVNVALNCKRGGMIQKWGGGVSGAYRALVITRAAVQVSAIAAGAAVSDAACFVRDTDNGQRAAFEVTAGDAFNGLPDRTYYAATNVSGQATLTPDLQYWSHDSANIGRLDWRTLAPDSNSMRLHVWSYAHQYATTDVDLGGGGVTAQPIYLSGDTSVTMTRAAAAALTQVATLDDLYDALKFWRCTAGNLEYPTVGTQPAVTSGVSLDIGSRSLVLDPAASAVVSIAGGVITVKGATLAAGIKHVSIKSTGTVTAVGGGVVSAPVVDANGDSYLSFADIDSWIVYSDPARTVQVGAGTGAQLFRFVYSSGVTYYLKCVAGSTEFAMVSTPAAAGETKVTLSTQALLTTLQAQVGLVKADTGFIKLLSL